jgi:hypothetical protein
MSNMVEISKGVWVPHGTAVRRVVRVPVEDEEPYVGLPRRAAGVMNPEDESEDEDRAPTFKEMVREAGSWGLAEPVRPLEPVAAVTYEQAREKATAQEKERQAAAARAAADAVAAEEARWAAVAEAEAEEDARRAEEARVVAGKTWAADGGAAGGFSKDSIVYKEKYTGTLWQNAPEKEQPEPFAAAWYSCVERWHFVQLGGLRRQRLIIEVELHGGTSLRHILYLDQVKGVLTKSNNRDTCGYKVMEEVIIDMRYRGNSFSPEQVRFKFMGSANAMAFHLALSEALDRFF